MKRKLLIFSVLAICVAILAAGTIAYFNAEGKAHNVITTGGVGIAVQEWADEARETPFEDLDGILPGTKVTKLAEIKNTGSAEAWIRVLVTKGIELAGGGEPDLRLLQRAVHFVNGRHGVELDLAVAELLLSHFHVVCVSFVRTSC